MMDYLRAKFGDFSFNRFLFYRADRQTDRQTESHTDADDRYTQATTVGVSSDNDGLVTTHTCCNKPCFFASTSSVHYAGRTRGAEIK